MVCFGLKTYSNMKNWEEEELEKFIRDNKDKFDVYQPKSNHNQHFLNKLINKFKEVINIVPYLRFADKVSLINIQLTNFWTGKLFLV